MRGRLILSSNPNNAIEWMSSCRAVVVMEKLTGGCSLLD